MDHVRFQEEACWPKIAMLGWGKGLLGSLAPGSSARQWLKLLTQGRTRGCMRNDNCLWLRKFQFGWLLLLAYLRRGGLPNVVCNICQDGAQPLPPRLGLFLCRLQQGQAAEKIQPAQNLCSSHRTCATDHIRQMSSISMCCLWLTPGWTSSQQHPQVAHRRAQHEAMKLLRKSHAIAHRCCAGHL